MAVAVVRGLWALLVALRWLAWLAILVPRRSGVLVLATTGLAESGLSAVDGVDVVIDFCFGVLWVVFDIADGWSGQPVDRLTIFVEKTVSKFGCCVAVQ